MDPNVTGLKFGYQHIKLRQFADDTTLVLDGSKYSLEAALNILETFGNFSGLKMNMEKTKVIWVGRKRFSKEKLNVTHKLQWGNTEFSILGLKFSTNLEQIPSINYTETIQKIKKDIGKWQNRYLTPLIKTKFLPKLIHLLTSLPIPCDTLKQINKIIYEFLWNHKPDKVSMQ